MVSGVAANARVALDAIGQRRYDVVLMNCRMPEMDGLEAMRVLRKGEAAVPGSECLRVELGAELDEPGA